MTGADNFDFVLDEELSEGDLVAMFVTTPCGKSVHVWAEIELDGQIAILRQFDIFGVNVSKGGLGSVPLREMAQAAMEVFNVDLIRIEETRRVSSKGPGRAVRPLRFRRRKS